MEKTTLLSVRENTKKLCKSHRVERYVKLIKKMKKFIKKFPKVKKRNQKEIHLTFYFKYKNKRKINNTCTPLICMIFMF